MTDLSPTARVLLAMIRNGRRTGYEIKQLVDVSTRFFWAASYGQIYPELRRLADAGLIEGTADPQGGRQRTVHRLTEAGREALAGWLASPPEIQEARDESLLKIFFSDFGGPDATVAALEAKRAHHLGVGERLRAIAAAAGKDLDSSTAESSTALTLRFGIAYNEFAVEWCERELKERRG
jgi:DNA-binding PadR family transcriptional regulator